MAAVVYIDDREKKLLSIFKEDPIHVQHLDLGDIHLHYEHLDILIERKTMTDFWQSIVDHRFQEQRARLYEWQNEKETHKVIYLMETCGHDLDPNKKETVEKAIHRLSFLYQMMVYRVGTPEQSCEYIRWLSQQTTLWKDVDTQKDKMETWTKIHVPKKKDVQTSSNLILILLMSLHGISHSMATHLTLDCASVSEYIDKLKTIPLQEYSQIKVTPTRQLGMKKAILIYQLLGIESKE